MDFFETVRKRYSVRMFRERDIEDEKLEKVLEAANLAPSAGNLQAYEIVVVKDAEKKRGLSKAALEQDFIAGAPVVLVIFANELRSANKYGKRGRELYCINDASIAAAYIQLAATALGLGTCWVGAIDDDAVKEILNAPEYLRPVAIIPIGYPDEEPEPKERRGLTDIVHGRGLNHETRMP